MVFFEVVLIKIEAYIYSSQDVIKQNKAVTKNPGLAT